MRIFLIFRMIRYVFIFSLVFPIVVNAGGSAESAVCKPPANSQWHWSLKKLTLQTDDIVVARLIEKKNSGKPPTLKPDFSPKGGLAIHGRRDSSGKRKSQLDDIWNSIEWTFEVEEALKGRLKKGEKLTFTTLDTSADIDAVLTHPLCDYPLHFESNKEYLIFYNSFNPNGYQSISDGNKTLLQKVKHYLPPK